MHRFGWGLLLMVLVGASQPAVARRPVIVEEFTATWCGFCYAAGCALDRLQAKYPLTDIIVISYHIDDDFANSVSEARRDYYEPPGYPTAYFNGLNGEFKGYSVSSGENGIRNMYTLYNNYHLTPEKERIGEYAPFNLILSGDVGTTDPQMTLTIRSHEGYPHQVRVHLLIIEDNIPVSAPNGQTVLNFVARADLGNQLITLSAGGISVVKGSYTGTIPCNDAANLKPIAFVQDENTNEILGAVGSFNLSAASHWELYK